jgi:hypothetical protein
MISEQQVEANRRNAHKSTGPRTEAGKRSSSGNATTHGVYANGGIAISRGPLRESEAEIEQAVMEVAASLEPRDAVEWRQARLVGSLYVKLQRLDAFEARSIAFDSDHPQAEVFDQVILDAVLEAGDADALYEALTEDLSPDDEDWFYLADFVLRFANDGKFIPITDLWTPDRTPQNPAEWKRATLALVRHFFGDLSEAAGCAKTHAVRRRKAATDARTRSMEIASKRVLDATLAKVFN